jgi:D-alanyl-D-alanine dipeptidase
VSEPVRGRVSAAALAAALLAGCLLPAARVHADAAVHEPVLSDAKTAAEAGLVDVATRAPGIRVDMRYAGPHNFTGERVDGYHAPRCLLLAPAAEALAKVEQALRRQGLRLQVFDCYRPTRAVRHFVEWAGDLADQRTKPTYYPNLDKRVLLGDYIAPVSGHSRGASVDLTLLRCARDGDACMPLDMGTPFDFFDLRAHTDAPGITPAQSGNRQLLRAAMEAAGFRNYPLEWWHYTLQPEPAPRVMYDVPVQ